MASVFMPNPQNVVLIRLQARESDLFEAIHDVLLHCRRDDFTGRERQHTALVLVLKRKAVDQPLGGFWIAPQYGRRWVARLVVALRLPYRFFHAVAHRASAPALPATGKPNDHGLASGCSGS